MRLDRSAILAVATGSASQIGLSALAALVTTLLLPVEDRGRYVLLVTVVAVTAPLAGLGSNVGLRRMLPTSLMPDRLESAYLRLSIGAAIVHGVVAPFLLLAVTRLALPRGMWEAVWVGLLTVTFTLSWQFVELWYARLRFKTGAAYATAGAATALAAACFAAVSPSFVGVVAVQALSGLVLHVVQLLHLHRSAPPAPGPSRDAVGSATDGGRVTTFRALATGMVGIGAPSLVMTAGMALTFRLDRVILGAMVGSQAVAVYALAGSFSELPRFIPASFGQVANGQAALSARRLPLSPHLVPATLLTLLAAVGAGAAGYLFILHADPTYRSALLPMLVLLGAELLLVPYSIVIRIILGGGRIKLSAGVGLVALAMSALTYWLGVSHFGLMGAAWASLVVYVSVSAASLALHFLQRDDLELQS